MNKPSESAKRLIIADDDPDICEVLRLLLEGDGRRVSVASTTAAVMELSKTRRFDLYILDNWFLDGSGIDLCRQLHTLYPDSHVILISGFDLETDIAAARAAGADDYFVKPFDFGQLRETVDRLLL